MRALSLLLLTLFFFFDLQAALPQSTWWSSAPCAVHGSVNVITGQYVEDAPQIVVNGPFDLRLSRAYIGPDKGQLGNAVTCWSMGTSYLTYFQKEAYPAKHAYLLVDEPSGSRVLYRSSFSGWSPDLGAFWSNIGSGEISGRTHPGNREIRSDGLAFQLSKGDGERWLFSSDRSHEWQFRGEAGTRHLPLRTIERANGQRVELRYEEGSSLEARPRPERIALLGSKGGELGWMQYIYTDPPAQDFGPRRNRGNHANYSIAASDGQRIDYEIGPQCRQLQAVKRLGWPDIRYDYTTSTHSHYTEPENVGLFRLSKRTEGEFYLENAYYEAGINRVGERCIEIKSAKAGKDHVEHPSINAVCEQFAPVGPKGERVSIARYFYNFDPGKNYAPGEVAGSTDVFDASDNLTRYRWTAGQRITSAERFEGCDRLLMRESYVYREGSGELLGKVLFDGERPVVATTFKYDAWGNVISETLWGDLKGNSVELELDGRGLPKKNGVNRFCREFKYKGVGKTGQNLLVEECSGGMRICYSYLDTGDPYLGKHDLLASVTIYDGEQLYEQTSYRYDENGVCIEQERHCGSHSYMTKVEPVSSGAAIGLPRRIEEYAGKRLLGAVEREYGIYNLPVSETYYDANNQPIYTLTATYDAGGRPVRVTGPMEREIVFAYDQLGRLVAQRGPRDEDEIRYTYDQANRLTAVTSGGVTYRYAYDAHSRVVEALGPYGQRTAFRFNALGELIEEDQLDGSLEEGERRGVEFLRPSEKIAEGSKWSYAHRILALEVTDPLGEQESHRYNARGQIVSSRFADGTTEEYRYGPEGNLLRKIDRLGVITTATYNGLGQLLSVQEGEKELHLTYDGELINSTWDGSLRTEMEYDEAGRLIAIHAGNRCTEIAYDPSGRKQRQRAWFGKGAADHIDTVWEYDACNRIISERVEDGVGKVWSRVDTLYDKADNVVRRTTYGVGERPEVSTFAYDGLNRLVLGVDPLGGETRYEYGETIDASGRRVDRVTDALGSTQEQSYDSLGRLATSKSFDAHGQLTAQTDYVYDASSRLIEQCDYLVLDGKEEGAHSIRWGYGPGGRIEAIYEGAHKTTRFEYEDRGLCSAKILPNGDKVTYTYDEKGRLIEERGCDYFHRYTYDWRGNVVKAEGGDGATYREFDVYGQLVGERLSNGLSLAYTYDRAGRRLTTRLPDGSSIEYVHDPIGVSQVKRGSFLRTLVARDLSGRPLLEKGEPGGLAWSYKWDLCGRLSESKSPDGVARFTYDKVGRLTSSHGRDGAGPFRESYRYDGLSQLTQESGSASNRWRYDSFGNRREANGKPVALDGQSRPVASYTRNHCVQNLGENACDYDRRDRLKLLNNRHGQRFEYTYDAFNRRVKERRTSGSHVEECCYLYDGVTEIGRWDATRRELRFMMDCGDGERPRTIGMELDGELFSAGTNHRGDIAVLFDVAGRSVESVRYSAFGDPSVTGEGLSPWGFSGKRSDPTGLIYFGQRYYAPELGRWLSPDPWGFIDGSNLYHFCRNNPLSFVDWLGLSSERGGGGIGDLDRRWGDHRQGNQAHSQGSRGVVEAAIVAAAAAVAASGKEIGRACKKSWRWLLGKKPHNRHLPERSWMTTLQGGMQTLCGMTEVWIGGMLCSTGIGVPLGVIIAAHGFDQAFTGVQTVWTGQAAKSLARRGLEGLGVAPEWAEATDTSLAVVFTVGGSALVAGGTRVAVAVFAEANTTNYCRAGMQGYALQTSARQIPESLNRFHRAVYTLPKAGQRNIRALRGWAKSKGWVRAPNPQGGPEQWGVYRNAQFEWRLKIKPEPSFRPGLEAGSRASRFDARLDVGGDSYINPFTGSFGSREVGTHIPLEYSHW